RRALDHATLPGRTADQGVDRWARYHRRLQTMLRFGISGAGLEHVAQQMVRWNGANAPRLHRIQGNVIRPQPGPTGAPPHRRLVDAGGEASRSRSGQDSDVSRPSYIVEIAGDASHPCDFNVASKPRKWPIERAYKPGGATLFARKCGTPPLITAIEKPNARKTERGRDAVNFRCVRRSRSHEPMTSHEIHRRQQTGRDMWQPVDALVTQGSCTGTALRCVAKRPIVTDIDDRNYSKRRWRQSRHIRFRPSRTR